MTWFRKDDRFPTHSKARAAGKDGRALWDTAGPLCAAESLDGVVPPHMLTMWAAIAEVPARKATRLIVDAGLWHPADQLCDRCLDNRDEHAVMLEAEGRELTPLEPGSFYFHDWTVYQLEKDGKDDPIKRKRNRRRKQLRETEAGKQVTAAVRERDVDRCRYCGVLTVWTVGRGGDQRSADAGQRGTIDHLNPFDWSNTVVGTVCACRRHNGQKRDRNPADWLADGGLPLLPERWWEVDEHQYLLGALSIDEREDLVRARIDAGPNPDQSRGFGPGDGPGSVDHPGDLAAASRDARDGPGDWSGRGPGDGPGEITGSVEDQAVRDPQSETPETGDDS